MSQLELTGWDLAQAGGEQALEAAERRHPGWRTQALACLVRVGMQRGPGTLVTAEEIRAYAHGAGQLPEPRSMRAWGPILLAAERQQLVERAGTDRAKDPRVHGNMVTAWRFTDRVQRRGDGAIVEINHVPFDDCPRPPPSPAYRAIEAIDRWTDKHEGQDPEFLVCSHVDYMRLKTDRDAMPYWEFRWGLMKFYGCRVVIDKRAIGFEPFAELPQGLEP